MSTQQQHLLGADKVPKRELLGNPGRFSSAMFVLECILQGRDRGSLPTGTLENPLLNHPAW